MLLDTINAVLTGTGRDPIPALDPQLRFVQDLKFDSLDFAELGVRLESATGTDPLAKGIPVTVGELL